MRGRLQKGVRGAQVRPSQSISQEWYGLRSVLQAWMEGICSSYWATAVATWQIIAALWGEFDAEVGDDNTCMTVAESQSDENRQYIKVESRRIRCL